MELPAMEDLQPFCWHTCSSFHQVGDTEAVKIPDIPDSKLQLADWHEEFNIWLGCF